MRTLISLGMAALFLGFVFSADLDATEPWEQKLMNEGWVMQKEVFLAFADTTWYGRKSKYSDRENRVFYIVSSGKKVFFQLNKGGTIHLGIREKFGADSYCTRFEFEAGGRERCYRTVWKKGNVYLIASFKGYVMGEYAVKKGNVENFK